MGFQRIDLGCILHRVELQVTPTNYHLPEIVHAVARRFNIALVLGAGKLVPDDVEAAELMHHGHRKRRARRPQVNDSALGKEGCPLGCRIDLVASPVVELERDFFPLNGP